MKRSLLIAISTLLVLSGLFAGAAVADREREPGDMHHRYGERHHGADERHMRQWFDKPGGGHHGREARLLGGPWKATLSDEQRARIDDMHVAFAKIKAPLKAKVRLLKAELAVLATADQPDNKAISSKIDELLAVKKQLMQKRYAHIAEMRKVLTTGQRASFDMQVLKKVKGKRRYHH